MGLHQRTKTNQRSVCVCVRESVCERVCVIECLCVREIRVCVRERERERERVFVKEREMASHQTYLFSFLSCLLQMKLGCFEAHVSISLYLLLFHEKGENRIKHA
jgi:hypothetical protein